MRVSRVLPIRPFADSGEIVPITQPPKGRPSRARVLVTLAGACFVVGSAVVMHFRLGGLRFAANYDDIAELCAAWLSAAACLWASRRGEPRMRRSWQLFGASVFFWGAGQAVWGYYEVILGGQAPSPSLADVGFLAAVPLMVGALLVFPVPPVRSLARAVMLLDGGAVAASTLFVSWALVLGPVYRSHQGDVLSQVVTLAYPAGDVLIVIVLLSVAVRASRAGWIPLAFVGTGVLGLAFSDSAFAYLSQSGDYGVGLNVDIGWILAFILIGLAPIWTGATEVPQSGGHIAEPSRPAGAVPPRRRCAGGGDRLPGDRPQSRRVPVCDSDRCGGHSGLQAVGSPVRQRLARERAGRPVRGARATFE